MENLLSEPTMKLSRNLKAVSAIALLYFAFFDQFGPTLRIFGNDIPGPAIRTVIVALIAYHASFLVWHAANDSTTAQHRSLTELKSLSAELHSLQREVVSFAALEDDHGYDFYTLDGIDTFIGEYGGPLSDELPERLHQLRHVVSDIELYRRARDRNWWLSMCGHVGFPILLGCSALTCALRPELVSWLGEMLTR